MRPLLFLLLCGMLPFSSAAAQHVDVLAALVSRDFSALEEHFESVDSMFDQHALAERDLVDAYRPLYQREDKLTGYLADWIEHKPKSHFAYLARGIYFRKLGELNRGTRYISETPQANLDYMSKMFALAKDDLYAAQRLHANPYLVALHLLNIAQYEGDRVAAMRNLDLATKAYPGNFMARARYLISLEPRWGGSHALMHAFVEESAKSGASEQQVRWLEAIEHEDRGAVSMAQHNSVDARKHFVEALRLAEDAGNRFRSDYLETASWYCLGPKHGDEKSCVQR